MVFTRGDVESLDAVEDEQSWDEIDVPALPDDVAFTTGDWLNLLKPRGESSIRSWRLWKRLSGMVAVVSGIALVVITFSSGRPVDNYSVNLETAAGAATEPGESVIPERESDGTDSTPSIAKTAGVGVDLLSSSEARFLGFTAAPTESTTSTTVAPTTTEARPEPVIAPESEWVDAGHGVAVPDVLLRIRYCESTNNYRAAHAVSSARGAYQFLTKSWEWYGHAARYSVARADLATPAEQDEAAVMTLRRDGTGPWLASKSCWAGNLPANYATIRPPAQPTTTTAGSTSSSSPSSESTTTTVASSTSTTASTSSTASSTSSTDTTATTASTSTPESTSTTSETTSSTADTSGSTSTDETTTSSTG